MLNFYKIINVNEIRHIECKHGDKWKVWGEKSKHDSIHLHVLVYSSSAVGN
jgi:hypothetical protein